VDDRKPAGRLALAAAIVIALATTAPLAAQEGNDGLVVPIPTSLTTEFTNNLRATVNLRHEQFKTSGDRKDAKFYLICDFNPDGKANSSDTFGASLDLARYLGTELREMRPRVWSVAYVHGKVTRHAVLPVLACDEIIMSSRPLAQLGEVAPVEHSLDKQGRGVYEEIGRDRYPRLAVLIRKMCDRDLAVFRAPADKEHPFVDGSGKVPPGAEAIPELAPGSTALYTFPQARDFGLCRPIACNSIDEVLAAYHLPATCLIQPLDHIVAWRVLLSGTIDGEMEEKLHRRVDWALARNANLLIFQLSCSGGDAKVAARMGQYLADLGDKRRPLETVAFVTNQAGNTAAFLALGCDKIVMQGEQKQGDTVIQPGGHLGGFDDYFSGAAFRNHPEAREAVREDLAAIAAKRHHPTVLAEGFASRELRIYGVVEKTTPHNQERRYLRCISEEDYRADEAKDKRWRIVETVKPRHEADKDQYLTLNAQRARDLKLATDVVNSFEELCDHRGISPADVQTSGTDWIDTLTEFLRHPWTSAVLVMLGIMCLILELKMPGVVMPGIIAAICFVLFFWSQSQLHGQITWLAILLFLLGLVLIALEVFVLPGFGVAGISGILLVLCSLGLVAYGHWPTDQREWGAFAQHVGPFGLSILGALTLAILLAKYLPNIPYVNRLILQPQAEMEEGGESTPEGMRSELAELLGAIGVAATPLRPAGKVQFGEAFVDVVAEGSYILPGSRVQVIEIEGNRVVVKEV
jgi:membrane-bound ClpP family serine protease